MNNPNTANHTPTAALVAIGLGTMLAALLAAVLTGVPLSRPGSPTPAQNPAVPTEALAESSNSGATDDLTGSHRNPTLAVPDVASGATEQATATQHADAATATTAATSVDQVAAGTAGCVDLLSCSRIATQVTQISGFPPCFRRVCTNTPTITAPDGVAPVRGWLVITGTAEPGATVNIGLRTPWSPCFTNGVCLYEAGARTTANTDGNWSASIDTSALSDALYTVGVTANAEGKDRSLTATRTIIVDNTAPVVTVVSADTLPARSKLFSASDDDPDDPGVTVWKYLVQSASNCAAAPPENASSYTEGATVEVTDESANNKYVCFWSTDEAGNVGVGVSAQIGGIDRTAPTIAVSASQSSFDVGQTVTVTFTPSETITGFVAADIELSASGVVAMSGFTAEANGSYTVMLTGVAAGSVSVSVGVNKFADMIGHLNVAASNTLAVTVNAVVPSRTATPVLAAAGRPGPQRGQLAVAGTAETGAAVVVALGSLTKSATATGGRWSVSFDTALLSDGEHALSVKATAANKSESLPATRTVKVDNTAPVVTVVSADTSPARLKLFSASDADVAGAATWRYLVQSPSSCVAVVPGAASAYTEGRVVEIARESANGKYVCFWSTDEAGNVGVGVSTRIGGIDRTAPTIAVSASQSSFDVGQTSTVTFTPSEAIVGFEEDDIDLSVSGVVTMSGFTAEANGSYTVMLTGVAAGSVSVSVGVNKFADMIGHLNVAASNALAITVNAVVLPRTATPVITAPDGSVPIGSQLTVSGTAEEDVTEIVARIVTAQGVQVAPNGRTRWSGLDGGRWSGVIQTHGLNGDYILSVTAIAPGKSESLAATRTVMFDTSAPQVTIVSADTSPARSKSFSASDTDQSATTWRYLLRPDSWCPAMPPGQASSYTEGEAVEITRESDNGKHVCFWSTDLAGNVRVRVSTRIGGIDRTAPTIRVYARLSRFEVGQTSTVTFAPSEAVVGFKMDDIDLSVSGVVTMSGFTAKPNGSYTVALTGVAAGSVEVSVGANRFSDRAGNPNVAASNALAITVNMVRPSQTATPIITTFWTVPVGGQLTISGTAEAGAAVTAILGSLTKMATATDGNWSVSFDTALLSDGEYALSVKATAAGKSESLAAAVSYPVTVDNTAPVVTVVSADTSPARSKLFSASADDKNTWWRYLVQSSGSCAATPPATARSYNSYKDGAEVTVDREADNGKYVCFWSIDGVGNVGVGISAQIGGIDRTAPTMVVSASRSSFAVGETVMVTFTPSEPIVGFNKGDIESSRVALSGFTAEDDGSYTVVMTSYHTGSVEVSVRRYKFTDRAGNPNKMPSNTLTLMVHAVVSPQTATPVIEAAGGSGPQRGQLTVSGTAEAGVSVVVVLGSLTESATATGGRWSVSFDTTSLSDGEHALSVKATATGRTESLAATRTIKVDNTVPVVTVVSADTSPARSKLFSASDDDPGVTVWRYLVQSASSCAAAPPGNASSYTERVTAVSVANEADNGRYVCFWSTDQAGNVGVGVSAQIGGIDRTAPTIAVSASQSGFDVGQTATVTFTPSETVTGFTATDIGLSVSGVVTMSGFTAESDGSYTVVLTGVAAGSVTVTVGKNKFADRVGNPNVAASNALVVTVNAVVPARTATPMVMATDRSGPQRGLLTVSGTAEAGATVTVVLGSLTKQATAAGGSWSVRFDTASLADGEHALSVKATATGKTESLAATRKVKVDNTAPKVTITAQPAGGAAKSKSVTATAVDAAGQVVSFGYKTHSSSSCPAGIAGLTAHRVNQPLVLDQSFNGQYVCFYATDQAGNVGHAASQLVTGIDPNFGNPTPIPRTPNPVPSPAPAPNPAPTPAKPVELPTVSLSAPAAVAVGELLRFEVKLSKSATELVTVGYSAGSQTGELKIRAGQLAETGQVRVEAKLVKLGEKLKLKLDWVKPATLRLTVKEAAVLVTEGVWQTYTVLADGTLARSVAQALGLAVGQNLYSWNVAQQRWHMLDTSPASRDLLAAGESLTFKGVLATDAVLRAAGLGRLDKQVLGQGWNIFMPAKDTMGLSPTSRGTASMFFDSSLTDCVSLAGILVIYTYDQTDKAARNGFRLALPCHPQQQRNSGYPAITTIDQHDTVYAWFNSTTPVTIRWQNGRYTPVT